MNEADGTKQSLNFKACKTLMFYVAIHATIEQKMYIITSLYVCLHD